MSDDPAAALDRLLNGLIGIGLPVLFLAHPRTRRAVERFGLEHLLEQMLEDCGWDGGTEFLEIHRPALRAATD